MQQEDLTIVNIYTPNLGAGKYINQVITKLKKHFDNNTIIVRDLTPHSQRWKDHLSKRSTRKQGL